MRAVLSNCYDIEECHFIPILLDITMTSGSSLSGITFLVCSGIRISLQKLVILLSGRVISDEMTASESPRANVSEHSRGICVHDICKDCSPIAFHPPLSDHEELFAYFLGIIIASITVSSNSTLAKTFPPLTSRTMCTQN